MSIDVTAPGRRRAISGHNGVSYPVQHISLGICWSSSKHYRDIIKSRRYPIMSSAVHQAQAARYGLMYLLNLHIPLTEVPCPQCDVRWSYLLMYYWSLFCVSLHHLFSPEYFHSIVCHCNILKSLLSLITEGPISSSFSSLIVVYCICCNKLMTCRI